MMFEHICLLKELKINLIYAFNAMSADQTVLSFIYDV